jgi:preprotein translocase subunit SecE
VYMCMPIVLRVYDKKQMHYWELVIDEACKTYYPNKDLY